MKFRFIANACGIFESKAGTKILSDPWLNDGAFSSWCHFHRLETSIKDVQDVDGIYVSHLHMDHYDHRYFDFPKEMPIFLLDAEPNYLHRMITQKGYANLIKIKDGESFQFKDFTLTMFKPFCKHPFFNDDAVLGNIIDSALILQSDGHIAFNANDNSPTLESCLTLKERFGKIDLAMLNYNAAGPYPACFSNLSEEEKAEEHTKVLTRNFNDLLENIKALEPKYMLPFAGAYVIGGRMRHKNRYLGTTTWDVCADYLRQRLPKGGAQVICLRENDVFDIGKGKSNRPYVPVDEEEMFRYIDQELSKLEYEVDSDPEPDLSRLRKDMRVAKEKMFQRSIKLGIKPDTQVEVVLGEEKFLLCDPSLPKARLTCSLDARLMRRILDRRESWNNAEASCLINFHRRPNLYSPDIHTMLQFFHL